MFRIFRRVAILFALMGLWAAVGGDYGPSPVALAQASVSDDFDTHGFDKSTYDLAALKIFNRVVLQLKDSYVDPKRIDPKLMLVAALDAVEKTVAEVMVDGDDKSSKIKVTVGSASRDFDISNVDSLWKMSFALRDVFDFISKHLVSHDQDQREIEYAAVNGMLSTLDPHSILLKPDYFKEMKLQTKGEFGGLGFVIQMKEGNLTVVRVLKNTPASKNGIKPKDVITKIGEESTINMDLNDAVGRLRGKPDSRVSITVARAGWPEPKPFSMTRAIISIESVESKLLADGVGYIKLKTFQGNSSRDIESALSNLKAKNGGSLKGLVLDLRGNPGGLLEQAIQVSDLFVSEGTIVTTVGMSDKMREVKKAHAEGTEADLPLAVLVNSGSASASEIVAGALKNLNRAVIVGRQTFGKGSVQVLYDFPDESALKLTIAQYLTPGDISIQEVGITPDVELNPARVTKNHIDVFAPHKSMGEADLEHHLTNPGDAKPYAKRDDVIPREQPEYTLSYLKEEPKKTDVKDDPAKGHEDVDLIAPADDDEDADSADADDDLDKLNQDFQVTFSRDLLLAAPANDRRKIVQQAHPFMDQQTKAQQDKISKAIETLGVNWSASASAAGPGERPKVSVDVSPPAATVTKAGDPLQLTVTVHNDSNLPAARVRGYTESENPYLDRREFVFGEIPPHDKRSWTVPINSPKDLVSRRDVVTTKILDDQGVLADGIKSEVNFAELPRPSFAYSVQVVDSCKECNGDGITDRGEMVNLVVDVKNIGTGKAPDAYASIKNDADENVFIDKGRFKLGELAPGETKTANFSLQVKRAYKGDTYAIKMAIVDEAMEDYLADRLVLPVADGDTKAQAKVTSVKLGNMEAARGTTITQGSVAILAGARTNAPVVASAHPGLVLTSEARVGDFYRVVWAPGRTGFVPVTAAHDVPTHSLKKGEKEPRADGVMQHSEPKVVVNLDTAQGGLQVGSDHLAMSGSATDPSKLRDLYIFVNDKKVFFRTNGDTPQEKIDFATDLPLKAGNNTVIVVAREDDELVGRRTLVIHRGDAELAQQSPTK